MKTICFLETEYVARIMAILEFGIVSSMDYIISFVLQYTQGQSYKIVDQWPFSMQSTYLVNIEPLKRTSWPNALPLPRNTHLQLNLGACHHRPHTTN